MTAAVAALAVALVIVNPLRSRLWAAVLVVGVAMFGTGAVLSLAYWMFPGVTI